MPPAMTVWLTCIGEFEMCWVSKEATSASAGHANLALSFWRLRPEFCESSAFE
ncbi:hypothetical protein RRSWK_05405 [Rhodopirellula sp. SWK7]|nr:hypothetical protein RRSWK_05405 [Rhodopirellula sp. SWK7]